MEIKKAFLGAGFWKNKKLFSDARFENKKRKHIKNLLKTTKIMAKRLQNKTKKNSGQITMEYILLAVALLTLFKLVANIMKNNGHLKSFQDRPIAIFRGLVEDGNWKEKESKKYHPNHLKSHYSSKGSGSTQ